MSVFYSQTIPINYIDNSVKLRDRSVSFNNDVEVYYYIKHDLYVEFSREEAEINENLFKILKRKLCWFKKKFD